jgi:hypothetical protein
VRPCFDSRNSGRGLLAAAVILVALAQLDIEAAHDIAAAEAMGEFFVRASAALRAVFVIQTIDAFLRLLSGIGHGAKRNEDGKEWGKIPQQNNYSRRAWDSDGGVQRLAADRTTLYRLGSGFATRGAMPIARRLP